MTPSKQNWQTTIWVNGTATVVYGHSLYGLRREVGQTLQSNNRYHEITEFTNYAPSTHKPLQPMRRYLLLDSQRLADVELRADIERAGYTLPDVDAKPGWYVLVFGRGYHTVNERPPFLDDLFHAAQDYAEHALVPEKGPDYVDPFAGLDTLPTHRIKSIMKTKNEERATDAIARGWHLLQLDAEGSTDGNGTLKDRQTVFVLGHPEPDAV